jgi:hypothetical protein
MISPKLCQEETFDEDGFPFWSRLGRIMMVEFERDQGQCVEAGHVVHDRGVIHDSHLYFRAPYRSGLAFGSSRCVWYCRHEFQEEVNDVQQPARLAKTRRSEPRISNKATYKFDPTVLALLVQGMTTLLYYLPRDYDMILKARPHVSCTRLTVSYSTCQQEQREELVLVAGSRFFI